MHFCCKAHCAKNRLHIVRTYSVTAMCLFLVSILIACGKKRVVSCFQLESRHFVTDSIMLNGVTVYGYNQNPGNSNHCAIKQFQFNIRSRLLSTDSLPARTGCTKVVHMDTIVKAQLIATSPLDSNHPAGSDITNLFQIVNSGAQGDVTQNRFKELSQLGDSSTPFVNAGADAFVYLTRYGSIQPNTKFNATLYISYSDGKILQASFPEITLL
jgi:hypothetical protein